MTARSSDREMGVRRLREEAEAHDRRRERFERAGSPADAAAAARAAEECRRGAEILEQSSAGQERDR